MRVSTRARGDVTIVSPQGMFWGGVETSDLETALEELIRRGCPKLLVHLGETTYMSSSSINMLLRVRRSCLERAARLKLCALNPRLEMIFVVAKLSRAFDVYATEEEALAAFDAAEASSGPGRDIHVPESQEA